MSKADKIVFVCRECGRESSKWLGKCPDCQAWNSFFEMDVQKAVVTSRAAGPSGGTRRQ